MRWASFEMTGNWEEEYCRSIGAHWEEERAAPNSWYAELISLSFDG
jgi:hypothetical protein